MSRRRRNAHLQRGRSAAGATMRPRADYDAVTDSKRRRAAPRSIIYNEDDHLKASARRQMNATTRDQARNFALAGWMMRLHTSYNSRFNCQSESEDAGWNRELESFLERRSTASNFDVAGQFSRSAALTMTERLAVLDGDHFWMKLADGRVQLIESDLVATASDMPASYTGAERRWVHGVEVDKVLRPLNYCICTRDGSMRRYSKVVRARNMLRRRYVMTTSQVRGISPLSPAINTNQDLYEGFDYNLIKAKLHALFGVAIFKKSAQEGFLGGMPVRETVTTEATESESDDAATSDVNEIKEHYLKIGQPSVLELDTTEQIELLESRTPSAEFRDYSELMIQIALLCLDIPFIFFNAKDGSFSIHRTARLEYERACQAKRDENEELLDEWTLWQVMWGIENGELRLPRGWTVEDVRWKHVFEGTPWFSELDEIDAGIAGIAAGIVGPHAWIRARGGDPDKVLADRASFERKAQALGLTLYWDRQPIQLTNAKGRAE